MSHSAVQGGANRLAQETSPYLLQHAHNPVDWYPWSDEALDRARVEDKPIFLSIGYAACHWCHVMAHESFENETVAGLLNEHFVSIKVDREERPDLDEIYMTAVQLMTGSGGWPMSVFLTPDLRPFYGGTYFPPQDMQGRPGFATVLRSVAATWQTRREDVLHSAEELTGAVQGHLAGQIGNAAPVKPELPAKAAAELKASFDGVDGGFGGAPKFPPTAALMLLMRQYAHTHDQALLDMVTLTLDKMAYGGMYDHLGGGFHRYSVDAHWLVPHFEKMLYDNALLAQTYLEAYQLTNKPLYRRIAAETLDYLLRDMTDPEGGFYSSEDADSEGQEGKYYLWTRAEILSALGEPDGRLFCVYYSVRDEGNFASHEPYHSGQNILHVPGNPDELARQYRVTPDALEQKMRDLRARLMAVRIKRVRPACDDKVLTSWNALAISALAKGYQVIGDERYHAAAIVGMQFLLSHMMREGDMLRTYREGKSRLPGYLDDYAFTANALLDIFESTFGMRWIAMAEEIARKMIYRFWSPEASAFYFTSKLHAGLLARAKPLYDGSEPSGNSIAALVLMRLGKLCESADLLVKARQLLEHNQMAMHRSPQAFLRMLCSVDFFLHSPKEIAIVGGADDPAVEGFLRVLHGRFIPNKIVAVLDPSSERAQDLVARIPLLRSKELVQGKPAAYICRDFTCGVPVTTAQDFLKALQEPL